MTDHFVKVSKKVLSLAAQAVLSAFTEDNALHDWKVHIHHLDALAAALRAAADHVEWPADVSLRIIASELEGTND